MKKITLLLSFLCAFMFCAPTSAQTGATITSVTRASEIKENVWYIMESRWASENISGSDLATVLYETTANNIYTVNEKAATSVGRSFNTNKDRMVRFISNEDGTYSIQWATGRYFAKASAPDIAIITTDDKDGAEKYHTNKITKDDGTYTFQFGVITDLSSTIPNYYNILYINDYSDESVCAYVSPGLINNTATETTKGSEWYLYEATVEGSEKAVTVHFESDEPNAPTYDLALGNFWVGETLSLLNYLPTTFANGLIKFDNQEFTVNEDESLNTITVKYTTSVPYAKEFTALNDEGKWVSFYTGNARACVYDKNATNGYPVIDNATFMNLDDNYFWGFICENPFTSPLYIVNKGAGPGSYLKLAGSTVNSICQMTNATTDALVEWTLVPVTKNPNGNPYEDINKYFGIKCVGTNLFITNYGGNGFMSSNESNPNTNAKAGFKFSTELETYRILATRALTAPEGAVNSLKAECRASIGDAASINEKSLEDFKQIIKRHEGHEYVKLVPGAYYRILNWQNYNEANAKVISFNGTNRALDVIDNRNVDQLWKIEADGTNYQLKNANLNKYLNRPYESNLLENPSTDWQYTLVDIGAGQHFLITANLQTNGVLSVNDDLTDFVRKTEREDLHKKNSKDAWYLMPVTEFEVKLNKGGDGNYYATTHFPFDIMVENAKAYVSTSLNAKNKLIMEEVTDKIIPANTALVIIGKEETATVKIKGVTAGNETEGTTETWAGTNVLSGTNLDLIYGSNTENITKDDVLIFGKNGKNVGFFKPSSSENVKKIPHNRAYLLRSELHTDSDQAATYATFSFAGDETGIDNVEADTDDEAVTYDVQGRRVNNNPSKGVYIVNGKKVLF